MAFKTQAPSDSDLETLYNVHMPVGPKPPCANLAADVMLVQLCLQQTFKARTTFTPPFPRPPRGQEIVVDGKVGPITLEAIVLFQNHVKHMGKSVRPDGIVNRVNDFSAVSKISHTIFTMIWLNQMLKQVIGEVRFKALEDDSITPFALKVALAAASE